MKASIEISMYPLNKEYGSPILDFINRLNECSEIVVKTNTMSTQVFGEYTDLMQIVTKEMQTTFEQDNTVIMVMKVINADLQ